MFFRYIEAMERKNHGMITVVCIVASRRGAVRSLTKAEVTNTWVVGQAGVITANVRRLG